jgi:uncharacterized alpha-E superfamily protein
VLARHAGNLFWLSRYMERAESIARLAEAGFRIAMIPETSEGHRDEWRSTLASAGVLEAFTARHETFGPDAVLHFLLFDEANPSSVRSSLMTARNNGRMVRTKITRDTWDALNSTWLAFDEVKPATVTSARVPEFLDWIRQRSALFRGALLGTILRDDTYYFSQLGAFVERADNTARILDVKYFLLLPTSQAIGGEMDSWQWEMILRSVSAHRSYRHVFRSRYSAGRVAEFLILRREMPRSLRFCYDWLELSITGLNEHYNSRSAAADLVAETRDILRRGRIEDIFEEGLHEFLSAFVARNDRLTQLLAQDYQFG